MTTRAGVYVQIPFCQTKCTYCNFHTGVFSRSMYSPYVEAVCQEIASFPERLGHAGITSIPNASVDTIYIGGGTPSLFDPNGLSRILGAIRNVLKSEWEEVTLEADPETITADKASAWLDGGFNRVSMGVQSFQDNELGAAGRLHRREDVFHATRILRSAGFQNVSFDLIAGLPHQTHQSWDDSLEQSIGLRPEHVSVYLMEIDEGSRLGLEVLQGGTRYSASALPSDDAMASFYERACARLDAAGYSHYEISNWALPGYESKHNLKYWRREPYFGFGAGAHSFNGVQRWASPHDPGAYMAAVAQGCLRPEQLEEISPQQALEEELFLGLRQLAGIDLARIESQYGASLQPRVAELCSQGLLELSGTRLRLAPNRLTVSNEAFVSLLN